ncbi:hypothetical protein CHS0354_035567 [Potamilus streckersoni]|uniref:Uncharacterized protein n=1 Tax=Potamilus streckersoni TaxID=2493646 RepID=A0AAE0RT78_9BIVA|nr:hypothetical protein CHS0354_035567 [Potamilus streckersoni]
MNLSKPPMIFAGAACGAVSLILGIAAIAVPKWLVFDMGVAQVSYGLWRACASVSVAGEVLCGSYDQTPGWIIATSAIEVAGICETLFAVLLAFLHISIAKNSKAAGKIPGPSAIVGGVIIIVGAIIWAAKYKNEPVLALCSLSVGFFLAIVSAILSIIAGILLFLGWRAESSEQPHTMF